MSLKGRKVVVGLTGGIACYKIPTLIRLLRKAGAEVRPVMTASAAKFITPLTIETVSGNPVAVEMFEQSEFVATRHIDLARWPDLMVVAPATANFLGKTASGITDDLLSCIVCARPKKVLLAPAMNPEMWANPITQRNYYYLRELGYLSVEPEEGEMACDETGVGRLAEPESIFAEIEKILSTDSISKSLEGKRILVTAGPTREAIDPVRFISNRSSGKMGFALAEAAAARGARTTLIAGPSSQTPPVGLRLLSVETTDDLYKAVKKEFRSTDCLIMAAAPADYRPDKVSSRKLKKVSGGLELRLKPTVDILNQIGRSKKDGQVIVGFALETENGVANARRKLTEKNLDMIVLNTVGEGRAFDADSNEVTILRRGKRPVHWDLMPKQQVAAKLIELVADLL